MKNINKYLLMILSILVPSVVLASGTAEQYRNIWLVIILIIAAPILGFFYEKMNEKNNKQAENNSEGDEIISKVEINEKQDLINSREAEKAEELKNKELLDKSIQILKEKGYSIKTLKYGWKVTAPNGSGRIFYDIEFLYSYAKVQ